MKTKMCILALLGITALSPCKLAQENYRGGIVHGPKAAFNISAPEGWVLDNESGVSQGNAVRSVSERFIVVGREDGDVCQDREHAVRRRR